MIEQQRACPVDTTDSVRRLDDNLDFVSDDIRSPRTPRSGGEHLLSALNQAVGANKNGLRLDIKVHQNAQLQSLVDALDAGTIAGFAAIEVTEVDGFQ